MTPPPSQARPAKAGGCPICGQTHEAAIFHVPARGGEPVPVPRTWYQEWVWTYPDDPTRGFSVRQSLLDAKQWLIDNPRRRKKNVRRYLSNWLNKAHRMARTR